MDSSASKEFTLSLWKKKKPIPTEFFSHPHFIINSLVILFYMSESVKWPTSELIDVGQSNLGISRVDC